MSKNIWIICEYSGSPFHGMMMRQYYLAKELEKKGYNATIISATYSHNYKNNPDSKKWFNTELIDGIQYVWIKVPKYKDAHSKIRILKWFVFAFSLLFLPKSLNRPDIIIVSSIGIIPIIPAKRLAKIHDSKLIFEVRDIWTLSILELGNYTSRNPFVKFLQWCEDYAYKYSDVVVSVLPNAFNHMRKRGLLKSKYSYIPNGVFIDELKSTNYISDNIFIKLPVNKFIVGYAGTIGHTNALEHLVEAAKYLDNKEIAIVIVGQGKNKEKLKEQVLRENLKNVLIFDPVDKSQIQSLLSFFDICYIGLPNKKIFQYGVSPNKLFDYMYAKKPILYAINDDNNVVLSANCGITVEPENTKAIADGILKFYRMTKIKRNELGNNGKNFVLENHTYDIIGNEYANLIESINTST